MEFFGQNHGLTLLGKSNVWDLNKGHFYNKERHLFFFIQNSVSVKNWLFLHFLLLSKIRQENVFQDILERKKVFLDYESNNLKNSKIGFFLRNCEFFHFFILSNIRQQNVFQDILERKKAFLDNKINNLKKSKKGIFLKGLVHSFVQKLAIFSFFLFLAKYAKKMCFKICQRDKTAFKAIKTRSRKTGIFPKGSVYGFGQKFRIFPFSYFKQYMQRKCLL